LVSRPDVEKILRAVPDKSTRQTLLFSATFPQDIQELAKFALRPGFQLIDTVGEDSTHSSAQVREHQYGWPTTGLTQYSPVIMCFQLVCDLWLSGPAAGALAIDNSAGESCSADCPLQLVDVLYRLLVQL